MATFPEGQQLATRPCSDAPRGRVLPTRPRPPQRLDRPVQCGLLPCGGLRPRRRRDTAAELPPRGDVHGEQTSSTRDRGKGLCRAPGAAPPLPLPAVGPDVRRPWGRGRRRRTASDWPPRQPVPMQREATRPDPHTASPVTPLTHEDTPLFPGGPHKGQGRCRETWEKVRAHPRVAQRPPQRPAGSPSARPHPGTLPPLGSTRHPEARTSSRPGCTV